MKKYQGVIAIPALLVAVAIAVLLAGGSWWYAQSKKQDVVNVNTGVVLNTNTDVTVNTNTTANTNVATNSNTNTTATADWKKYTNTEHHYSLKYPSDWKNDNGSNGNPAMFYDPVSQQPPIDTHLSKGSKIEVYVESTTSTSIQEYIKTVDADSKISSTRDVLISGVPAIRQAGTNNFGPYNISRIIKDAKLYTIVQYIPQVTTVEQYTSQFSLLLSTFTFLDETSYNVTNANILATARNDEKDVSKKYLKKIDTTTGKVQKEVILNVGTLEVMGGSHGSWGATDSVQFGADGDSFVFNATEQPGMVNTGYSYSSLYLSSFRDPSSQKRIVYYNNANKDTFTYIGQWKYDAKNHRVVFIEVSTKLEKSTYILRTVDTLTSEVKTIKSLSEAGWLITVSDTTVQLLITKANYEQSDLVTILINTGKVESTQVAFIESKLHQTGAPGYGRGGSPGYDPRALAPNGKMFAVWSDILNIHSFSTNTYDYINGLGSLNNIAALWSSDSTAVLAAMKDGGKIYKIGTGIVNTIELMSYPYIWGPGKYIIYSQSFENKWAVYRFDPSNNTSLKLDLESVHPSEYIGFGWVSS